MGENECRDAKSATGDLYGGEKRAGTRASAPKTMGSGEKKKYRGKGESEKGIMQGKRSGKRRHGKNFV